MIAIWFNSFQPMSRKWSFYFSAPIWIVPIFGDRMLVFGGHWFTMNKLLSTKYEWNRPKWWSLNERTSVRMYIQTDECFSTNPFSNLAMLKSFKSFKILRDISFSKIFYFFHTYYISRKSENSSLGTTLAITSNRSPLRRNTVTATQGASVASYCKLCS
jgi:hypothetical protein